MLVKSWREDDHLEDFRETLDIFHSYNMKLNLGKRAFRVTAGKFLGFMVSQRGIEANPDRIRAIIEMTPPKNIKEVQSLNGKIRAIFVSVFKKNKCSFMNLIYIHIDESNLYT